MIRIKSSIGVALVGGMLASLLGCSEANRNTAPVEVIATATIKKSVVDLKAPPAGTAIADIQVKALIKNTKTTIPRDTRFLDVRIQSYRVSYIRRDGGKTVPAPFVLSAGQVLTVNSAAVPLDNFVAFQPGAFASAPFPALLPNNGGIDPETGQRTILMDVKVEIFGETLSGQSVYATTRFPVDVCYGCTGV